MTTRRRRPPAPPPPRGRSGRFGLLPPLAIGHISVKALQLGSDADLLPQDARKHAAVGRSFEARKAAARVGAAPGLAAAGHENALTGRETEQLALRSPPAAAGTAPLRFRAYEGSSSALGSTGMPSVASSSVARSGCGRTVSRSTSPSASA